MSFVLSVGKVFLGAMAGEAGPRGLHAEWIKLVRTGQITCKTELRFIMNAEFIVWTRGDKSACTDIRQRRLIQAFTFRPLLFVLRIQRSFVKQKD